MEEALWQGGEDSLCSALQLVHLRSANALSSMMSVFHGVLLVLLLSSSFEFHASNVFTGVQKPKQNLIILARGVRQRQSDTREKRGAFAEEESEKKKYCGWVVYWILLDDLWVCAPSVEAAGS